MHWPARALLAALLLLAAFGGTAAAKDKVTICHRVGGPHYVAITIAPEAVLAGHVRNHPLDIIPAFTYVKQGVTTRFPGQNLTEEGLAILGNQCVPPSPPGEVEVPGEPTMPVNGGDVTLCHALGGGEYRSEVLDPEAVLVEHGDDEDDIIPAFAYGDGEVFAGRNLREAEVLILANGCAQPGEVAPTPNSPFLELTKSAVDADGAPLLAGDAVTFTIAVANTGKGAAHDVVIADAVPAGTDYVVGSATTTSGVVDVVDGYLVAHVGSGADETTGGVLAPGASATVTFSVTVAADLPPGAVILNLAHGAGVDPSTKEPLDPESNLIELPVDTPPVLPADIEVDPPARPPVPGGDVVVDVTTDPTVEVEDVRVCVSLAIAPTRSGTGRYPLGYQRTACSKPVDVKEGRELRRAVRLRVPYAAAGRCTRVTASVSARGFSSRSKGIAMCVRALPSGRGEAVTG